MNSESVKDAVSDSTKKNARRQLKRKKTDVEGQLPSEASVPQLQDVDVPSALAELATDADKVAEVIKITYPHVVIGGYTNTLNVVESYGLTQDDPQLMAEATNFSLDSGVTINFLDSSGALSHLELAYGLTAIFGVSASGKSELAKYLAYQLKIPVFRFSEPEIPSVMEPHILISEIEKFLVSSASVMIIDSMRFFVYNTAQKSAAGKGGVNTKLYSDLTALSVSAAFRRKSIIIVLNPMSDDDSSEIVFKALEGSISGIFKAKDYGSCEYAARTAASMRKFQKLVYSVDSISEPSSQIKSMEWLHGSHSVTDDFAKRLFGKVIQDYQHKS